MSNNVDLLDDHRDAWSHLLGERKVFRGQVKRLGHKHRQGSTIKKGATLLLVDVHLVRSPNKIDHAWVDYTPELAILGEHIRPNAIIEFSALVTTYIKGGKNIYGKGSGTYDDLQLTDISNVKVIKEPYLPKSYAPIVDDELVSYIIKTRQNLKQGLVVGNDPRGQLGKIRIGQVFCNKFAKTLSWRWINELPEKYGGGLNNKK